MPWFKSEITFLDQPTYGKAQPGERRYLVTVSTANDDVVESGYAHTLIAAEQLARELTAKAQQRS